ncbi:MAG: hypothetical protein R6U65_05220, partial [Perlabentimonas sp.]
VLDNRGRGSGGIFHCAPVHSNFDEIPGQKGHPDFSGRVCVQQGQHSSLCRCRGSGSGGKTGFGLF